MKFFLEPSLEHMALVKIGISLWNQNDVSALISKLSSDDLYPSERKKIEERLSSGDLYPRECKKIEERVIQKVTQLSIPQLLKEKVFGVIKPIGIQIFDWMQYYREYDARMEFHCLDLNLPAPLPAKLHWTPQGTVDRKRTAEVLVRDENLNVSRRYRLACDYFLEDDIIRLWNRLPEDVKDYDWENFPIVNFWSDNMKRGGAGHISYKNLFYSSALGDNKVAAYYFLQKLTPQEREESLEDLEDIEDVDVLCFLLSEMEEEEQKKVFKRDPYTFMQSFLEWPWQSFFIRVANCMWDFLPTSGYDLILGEIIRKVEDGYEDYNYQKLFRELWQKSPRALKDSFIDEIDNSSTLKCLFDIKDKENIRLILKDATLAAKAKLIYSEEIGDYLTRSIHKNEWDFLEFFIQECLPSKNEMLKFKEEFEKRMYFKECSATEKHKWNQLFSSSDDSKCKHDKRSVEIGESSSSKRFQSLQ